MKNGHENGIGEKIDRVLELARAVQAAESEAKQLEEKLRTTAEFQALEQNTLQMRRLRNELAEVFAGRAAPKTSPSERLSLRANIKSFLAAHKGETFKAADVARALNRKEKSVRVTLFLLTQDKEIKRPQRGMFCAKAA